ncbi:BamA/TamA family outer membrane protein [Oscillatoria sp. CS-180]|uniref:BamA/TamA family outer membrane protein n=1 Tax=Oscillatoria sp. CS-180 TaxID=3021720 RepID=UPI0023302F27|nr:BamA/TamA family outer membrane protein [Oscillatoria sp. CS-180]MDB9528564.1 BamA/TamA family outer membrane protein [Oscillatoria sp. CS-180]
MRQSPSLIALLTLSATLGIASQARGETLPILAEEIGARTVSVAELVNSPEQPATTIAPLEVEREPAIAETEASAASEETLEEPVSSAASADTQVDLSFPSGDSSETTSTFVSIDQLNQVSDAASESAADIATSAADISTEAVGFDVRFNLAQTEELPEQPDDVPADSPEEVAPEVETPDVIDEAEDDEADEALDDEETDEAEDEATAETQVLVAEVAVADPTGQPIELELEDTVYDAIGTRPGQTTTRSQIQQDINNIFATGFFANVRAVPSDTPLGVRVTYVVEPNPILSRVEIEGSEVLPTEIVDDIFEPQYGEIINLLEFQEGILELNNWYQDNGYVLAQVIAAPAIGEDGVVTLQVAEGVIEDINIRFMTQEGLTENEEGDPIAGKTRDFIILREFETEPGDVFQQNQIQTDLQRAFGLGIFDDISLTLNPGEKDPRQVDVTVNVVERNTGSVAAGVGFNFTGDLFGTLSYRQDNFGGNNQKFSAEAQLSTRDILFDVSFTDPWIGGDPNRTSYTLSGFARRSVSLVFDGGDNEINLANDDRVRIQRFGGGVTFRRPLGNNWTASLGTLYQRIRTTDSDGDTFTEDEAGNPLTASGTGADDLWTVQFGVVQDLRNDSFAPTSGSVLRLGTEQSIPLGQGSIFFNRLRASYSYYIPVSLLNFNEGAQTIAINVQGGTILGDFPPYEAFTLGGTNSVRGYEEGELGTGQTYLQASVEYRFPLFSFLGGAVFLDVGSDLGTGDSVPGSPGPDRDKPGSGFGYGAGVRVQTPLGPIRVDYGFSDQGDGRLHFGIGERF